MTDRIPRIVRFITEDEIIDDILNTASQQANTNLGGQHINTNLDGQRINIGGQHINTNLGGQHLNQQQPNDVNQGMASHFVAPFLIDLMASFPFRMAAAQPVEEVKNNHYSDVGIPCPESGPVQEAKPVVPRCLVCRTNMIQTVNFPCMHACFCLECAQPAVQHSKKCPQCRTEYLHISMLYLAYDDK